MRVRGWGTDGHLYVTLKGPYSPEISMGRSIWWYFQLNVLWVLNALCIRFMWYAFVGCWCIMPSSWRYSFQLWTTLIIIDSPINWMSPLCYLLVLLVIQGQARFQEFLCSQKDLPVWSGDNFIANISLNVSVCLNLMDFMYAKTWVECQQWFNWTRWDHIQINCYSSLIFQDRMEYLLLSMEHPKF